MSESLEVERRPGPIARVIGRTGIFEKPGAARIALIATILAVFLAGLQQAYAFYDMLSVKVGWVDERVLAQAAIYTGALMAILGTHEMGHWLVARRYGVQTSLPIFIPMPIGIGTFGAVIAMKEVPPTRRTLLRIGAAGPLAGGVVALLLMAIAFRWMPTVSIAPPSSAGGGGIDLGDNLATLALARLFPTAVPDGQVAVATPLFFAAWVGFLLTTLNLFPIGQLDGGHVAYALIGTRANRWARRIAVGVIALSVAGSLGLFGGGRGFTPTYAFWGLLAFFFFAWHPPIPRPEEPLTKLDYLLAAACLVLFAICFMPVPIRTT